MMRKWKMTPASMAGGAKASKYAVMVDKKAIVII